MRITETEWLIAQRVCTPRQVQILNYARRGWGARPISDALELDPSTVRAHLKAGRKNIDRELGRMLNAA